MNATHFKKKSLPELNRIDTKRYKEADKLPLIIILDNIRSMSNIGSVFRTSDAFRVEAIYLCGICSKPPHKEIHKTALGATESVAWQYFENTLDAIADLKQKGYKIVSVEQTHNSVPLQEFKPKAKEKIALILGNEVKGVEQSAINASDLCIEIPQYGTKHSLNIAVTTGIMIWHVFLSMQAFNELRNEVRRSELTMSN